MTPPPDSSETGNPAPDAPQTERPPVGDWHGDGRAIERVLGGLLDRVRRRFLVHGLGWVAAALAAGLLLYYVLDRTLDLPTPVRLLLSAAFAVYVGFGIRRRLVYPLRRAFAREDVAIAVERRFPELRQRLISAVQFARRLEASDNSTGAEAAAYRGESRAMLETVVTDAADEIAALPTNQILDPRRTVRVWAIAGVALLATGVSLFSNTEVAGVFFQRLFGASVSYPRVTTLAVELPVDSDEFQIELSDGHAHIVMPAGGDLPVLVRVEGVVPREVLLMLDGASGGRAQVQMSPRSTDDGAVPRFRHVFRRVRDNFEFHARGGDDPFGDRQVSVEVVEPPRVATVRAELTYPAYTRLEPKSVVGGSIEAVLGSQARIFVTATAPVTEAQLHLIDSDRRVELTPVEIQDDAGAGLAYSCEVPIDRSDRYQVEFVGRNGIGNPHPGTYPILALEDHAPITRLLTPPDDDLNVVLPGATLPVRVMAGDDFGVTSVTLRTIAGRTEHEKSVTVFAANPSAPLAPGADVFTTRLLSVAELGDPAVTFGDTIELTGSVVDNREPEPTTTTLPKRQIVVVNATDLGRRITSHFRKIRDGVEKALGLQQDRRGRLIELRQALDAGTATNSPDLLIAIEVGQGRVLGETRRAHRELMRSFDVHLFNGLEESLNAPKVVELYERFHTQNPSEEPLAPDFYRAVAAARAAGTLGAMEKTLDPILSMLTTADELATRLCPTALELVEAAGVTPSRQTLIEALDRAAEAQLAVATSLESLRGRLDEWNEFLDVITQTQSIRNRQRDVRSRTEQLLRNPPQGEEGRGR